MYGIILEQTHPSPVLVSFLFGSILEHQSNTSVLEYSATRVLGGGRQSQDNPGTASVTECYRGVEAETKHNTIGQPSILTSSTHMHTHTHICAQYVYTLGQTLLLRGVKMDM